MSSGHTLAHDPTAATAVHEMDDRFIPLRAPDLLAALAADHETFGGDPEWLLRVADRIDDVLDREASALGIDIYDRYSIFSPDRDTYPLTDVDRLRTPEAYADLDRCLQFLLEKANFEQLSDVQIEEAIRTANSFGLRIRLSSERLHSMAIWVRGRARAERVFRNWRNPLRGVRRTIEIYRRLAVVVRLRDDPHIHVKMFKDIPVGDVEALLPHAEVRMSWFDRLMVIGGGAGTVGTTASKAFSLFTAVAALGQLVWVLVVGLAMLTFRTFMGYRRARANRDSQRTRHLYYQNLSNNLGAISTLVMMITQEEEKEAVLAYAFCQAATPRPRNAVELAACVSRYLLKRFALRVEFDAADAIRTLDKLGLWRDRESLLPLPPDEAVGVLDRFDHRRRGFYTGGSRVASPVERDGTPVATDRAD